MKKPKTQNPNPKKIPNINYQKLFVEDSQIARWDGLDEEESMLLHEGPSANGRPYDLEERTAQFGEAVMNCSHTKRNHIDLILIGIWKLGFSWDLEFGVWNLFGFSTALDL